MAQFGSALGLGPRGRRFESCRPDHVGMDFAPFRFFFAEKSVICFVIPPYSQKGTLGSPVLLQALSRRFAVATTFLREYFRHKYLYSSAFTLLCHSSSIPQNLLDFARVPCGTVILNFTMFFTKSCKNTCTTSRQAFWLAVFYSMTGISMLCGESPPRCSYRRTLKQLASFTS